MIAESTISKADKNLDNYQSKLKKEVEKLEKDFALEYDLDSERFRKEIYPLLDQIDKKVSFIRKNAENSLRNNFINKIVTDNMLRISSLILKVANISKSFKSANPALATIILNCYHIDVELRFLLSWIILNLERQSDTREYLRRIEESLKLIDHTQSIDAQNIFASTIDNSFEDYIIYSINLAEKINIIYESIINSPSFSLINREAIEQLNKIKLYREKVKSFLKIILDHEKSQLQPDLEKDITITISQASWSQYVSLLNTLEDVSWCKISYADEILKLMCPGLKHENTNRSIDTLIVAYCDEKEMDYILLGSTTAKKQEIEKGKEPDSGYLFTKLEDDREIPDLAVEVNFSSGSPKDLSIYKSLNVKEVWIWQKRNTLGFYVLTNGEYKATNRSFFLKNITTEIISKYTALIESNKRKTRLYKKEFIAEINQDTSISFY
ncbi:MAG: Uma2 family endonuclease [Cyanobacteria bacterium P01_G01_bin.39]